MNKSEYMFTDLALENSSLRHERMYVGDFPKTVSRDKRDKSFTLGISPQNTDSADKKIAAVSALHETITELLPRDFSQTIAPVTVICLGNGSFTADSLGSACAPNIIATRHLKKERPDIFSAIGGRETSVLCTGTASSTGIDAADLAKICTESFGSRLIITIDSLKAAYPENLCRVIQITNRISPGSGVGNNRPHISEQTVGVPVISIGVPTAISSRTLLLHTLKNSSSIAPAIEETAIFDNLLVTPIDCCTTIKRYADIISDAINLTLIGTTFK